MVKKNTLPAGRQVTIDDLAVMVQKGFERTSTNEQVESLELRLNRIEKDITTIKGTMKDLVGENYKKRIEKLEDELKEIKGSLALIFK